MKTAREHLSSIIFSTFGQKVLVNGEKCPWYFQKLMSVKLEKYPWKRQKSCPWMQPVSRAFSARIAREPKKVPVNIVRKMGFTGTFDIDEKKSLKGTTYVGPPLWDKIIQGSKMTKFRINQKNYGKDINQKKIKLWTHRWPLSTLVHLRGIKKYFKFTRPKPIFRLLHGS